MSATLDKMNDDLKHAMKSSDEVTKGTIRWIKSAMQNAEMRKRDLLVEEFEKQHPAPNQDNGDEDAEVASPEIADEDVALTDKEVEDVLAKMAKQYRDSIDQYRTHGRDDLATKEEGELAVVLRYLPQQMSEDEVRALVTGVVAEVGATGPQDKGKVMGKLMPQVKGKADGSLVNRVVSEVLGAK